MLKQVQTWSPTFRGWKTLQEYPTRLYFELECYKTGIVPNLTKTTVKHEEDGTGPSETAVLIYDESDPENPIAIVDCAVLISSPTIIEIAVALADITPNITYVIQVKAKDPTWIDNDNDDCNGMKTFQVGPEP